MRLLFRFVLRPSPISQAPPTGSACAAPPPDRHNSLARAGPCLPRTIRLITSNLITIAGATCIE